MTILTDEQVMDWFGPNQCYEGIDLASTETAHREACEQKYSAYAQSELASLDHRQWLCVKLRISKVPEVDDIYSCRVGLDQTILTNPHTGEVCVYNSKYNEHKSEGSEIYLYKKTKSTTVKHLVYDGTRLIAKKSSRELRPLDESLSKSKKRFLTVQNNGKFDSRYPAHFYPYHILAAMFYGDRALNVVGPQNTHAVHHRNGNHFDNRLINLEILTTCKHSEVHGRMSQKIEESNL